MMDIDRIERSDFTQLHHKVLALVEATESGNVNKVKRLLKSGVFPEGVEKAASQALGNMDPLEYPDIAIDFWWFLEESRKPEVQRPSKRKLRGTWQRISRCLHLLLDAGAAPDAVNHDGETALNKMATCENLADIFQNCFNSEPILMRPIPALKVIR